MPHAFFPRVAIGCVVAKNRPELVASLAGTLSVAT